MLNTKSFLEAEIIIVLNIIIHHFTFPTFGVLGYSAFSSPNLARVGIMGLTIVANANPTTPSPAITDTKLSGKSSN